MIDAGPITLLWAWCGHALMVVLTSWALLRGGQSERLGALIILVGWIVTPIVQTKGVIGLDPGTTTVDVLAVVLWSWLSVKRRDIWVLFAASSMLVGTLGHLAAHLSTSVGFRPYFIINGLWSGYMLLAALGAGMIGVERRRAAIRNRAP